MPCSHASNSDDEDQTRGIERRDFLRTAVAIGGTNALTACLKREDADPPNGANKATGAYSNPSLPESQHSWDEYLVTDPHGNTVMPRHNMLLFLDYKGETPTQKERERVEKGFSTLEEAFKWGTGDAVNSVINNGLLFMMSYSNSYFSRFDQELSVDLPTPEEVANKLNENIDTTKHDAMLFLSSGRAQIVLGAEEALFGNIQTLNDVGVRGGLDGIFEKAERRTGFVGRNLPNKKVKETNADVNIPSSSPLFMGFKSGYTDNIPPDDQVSLSKGVFKKGTTQQVSQLSLNLESWYNKSDMDRIHQMYSDEHTYKQVGRSGHQLASSSGITPEMTEDLEKRDVLGHAQKTAQARDEDFVPLIVRRDFNTTHNKDPGLAFVSLQKRIEDFVKTRKAMNANDVDIHDNKNGILDFIDVKSRATFLVPPRSLRSLPTPTGES